MNCSGIWHKYHEWYFEIVIRNFTFSIKFFMGNGKPQTAKCHVTTALRSRLQFAVHVWTAGRASSGKLFYGKVFCHKKIVQPRVERYELPFCIRLRCVCWIFDLESMNYCWFFGDESDALRLDENNRTALNNERVVQINFIFLFALLTKESILFQSRVFFYLVTEFIT